MSPNSPTEFSPIGSKLEIEMIRLRQGLAELTAMLNQLEVSNTRFLAEGTDLKTEINVLLLLGFDTGKLRTRVKQLTDGTNTCFARLAKILAVVNDFAESGKAGKFAKLNPSYGIQTTDIGRITESLEKDAGELASSIMLLKLIFGNMKERLEALPPGSIHKYFKSNPDASRSFILVLRNMDTLSDMANPESCPVAAGLLKLEKSAKKWSLVKELNAILGRKDLEALKSVAQDIINSGRTPPPKSKPVPLR